MRVRLLLCAECNYGDSGAFVPAMGTRREVLPVRCIRAGETRLLIANEEDDEGQNKEGSDSRGMQPGTAQERR